MRRILKDSLSQHVMISKEDTTYSIEVINKKKDIFYKHVEAKNLWNYVMINIDK